MATPISSAGVERWLTRNAPRELQGLARGEALPKATAESIAKAFGAPAPKVAAAVAELSTALLEKARAGDGGFQRYGDVDPRAARFQAGRDGASLQRFEFGQFDTAVTRRLDLLTGGHRVKDQFPPPADRERSRMELRRDLRDVPVLGPGGRVMDVHQKIMADPVLTKEQKERVMDVLAEVRDAYLRLEAGAPEGPSKGYQIVNWKHTRGEIDQVLEGARLLGLDARATEDALLASIFSDAVKSPANFITHNIDGAYAAAEVLSRHLDPQKPEDLARIEGIVLATKEHQIGPPKFMGLMAANFLRGAIKKETGADPSPAQAALIASIQAKIASPLAPEHLDAGRTAIAFSADEMALLAKIGVKEWPVPHAGSAHHGASLAVITGDSLINYASPDGWAKIAAIRGPDTAPFFEDKTVFDSLRSAKTSYDDALTVIPDSARPLAEAGLGRTERAVERVRARLASELESRADVPRNPDGTVPFFDAPLKYPSQGPLSEVEQRQFQFAKELRARVVELLRAEQGVFS